MPEIIVQKHSGQRWDDYRRLTVAVEQIKKPDLPPRGGYRFLALASLDIRPGMRANVGGRFWDVLKVEGAEVPEKVTITLGQGAETTPGGKPAAYVAPFRTRAEFLNAFGTYVTSIPVEKTGDVLHLLHDYKPDEFAPEVGWKVKGRGFAGTIKAVEGRRLTLES